MHFKQQGLLLVISQMAIFYRYKILRKKNLPAGFEPGTRTYHHGVLTE